MHLHYFYHAGSKSFELFQQRFSMRNIVSLWNGHKPSLFLSSAQHNHVELNNYHINNNGSSSYPLQHFFSDSLSYFLSRKKEIKKTNEHFTQLKINNNFSFSFHKHILPHVSLKKFLVVGFTSIALQLSAYSHVDTNNINNLLDTSSVIHNNNIHDNYHNMTFPSTLNNSLLHYSNNIDKNNVHSTEQTPFSLLLSDTLSRSDGSHVAQNNQPQHEAFSPVFTFPHYMQSMFLNKSEAFLHLLHVAEGKQYKFYRDNKGIAIAYGWNPTRNTKQFNLAIAQEAGLDVAQTSAILKISDTNDVNFVPKNLKKFTLSPEQAKKTAIALMPHYEQAFLKAMTAHSTRLGRDPLKDIFAYYALPNNQQAVMIHMAYKVGGDNLLHYKTFYKNLFSYMDKPTQSHLIQVQDNFQYSYSTLDGQRLHDSRVEDIHSGFFSSCSIVPDSLIPHKSLHKDNISSKINQCRSIAHLDSSLDLKNNVASIQSKMFKLFG